ncbi:MAG: hypothetical protein NZM04_07215 [Methylacidiphilales bacterium]|nr:hypothetical protein [Candidatus Methylacidiphilales bacterium]MDW8349245.1 inositol monophosphatase [Verrucomicrobiae bacterium]
MPPHLPDTDPLLSLLIELAEATRDHLLTLRTRHSHNDWCKASSHSEADVLFRVDVITEEFLVPELIRRWPHSSPTRLTIEGLHNGLLLPDSTPSADFQYELIIDPIDGTRGLMYDKRPAWILIGLAPRTSPHTTLAHITHAVMVEIPTSKQTLADTFAAVRISSSSIQSRAYRTDLLHKVTMPLNPQPYPHPTLVPNSFASFAKFFPTGRLLTAKIEDTFWKRIFPQSPAITTIFDDQYISTGGQLSEILLGHDAFIADLRPIIHERLGLSNTLSTHPYDLCTLLIAQAYGCIVEDPYGRHINAPLDTTTPIAWVAYANAALAETLRPHLIEAIQSL